jgi:hypothetical protein
MRIVIEQGDRVTIESRLAGAAVEAVAAAEAVDGGGAPTSLIRQFAEGAVLAEAEAAAPDATAVGPENAEHLGDEHALNPLRAGAAVARGEAAKHTNRAREAGEGGAAPARPETDEA